MLLKVKAYFATHPIATLEDVARFCEVTPEIARELILVWLRKGKVVQLATPPGCGSECTQCQPAYAEEYQWL